jgi:hypothetical protein
VSVSLSRATAVFGERGFVSGFWENRAVFDKIELYFFCDFYMIFHFYELSGRNTSIF